jgi:EF hand
MYGRLLGLTTSALILACGATGAVAQNQMAPQPDQQQMQSHPMGQEGADTMRHGGMMGRDMMGRRITGGGMMGPPFMMRMIFALMDADGDGTLSLQEFQAAHERIFKAMDTNKDGKLTPEEMHAFMHGTR